MPPHPDSPEPPEEAKIGQSPQGPGSEGMSEDDINEMLTKNADEELEKGPSTSAENLECDDTPRSKGYYK